ncbi:TIR domain-containing protein [Cupriavidus basilensis]
MKIFLSHKSADKPLVRQFKQTLDELGFDPWLDEDAMNAGAELERAPAQGLLRLLCGCLFHNAQLQGRELSGVRG